MIFFTCRDLAIAAAFPLVFFLRAPSFLNLKAFISKGSALMLRQCKFQWVCLVMLGQRWSCCSHLHPKHFALLCLSFGSSLSWCRTSIQFNKCMRHLRFQFQWTCGTQHGTKRWGGIAAIVLAMPTLGTNNVT
jgi:hypothetical protein